jgi:hypothetical protein
MNELELYHYNRLSHSLSQYKALTWYDRIFDWIFRCDYCDVHHYNLKYRYIDACQALSFKDISWKTKALINEVGRVLRWEANGIK